MKKIVEEYRVMINSHTSNILRLNERLNKSSSIKQLKIAKGVVLREKAKLHIENRLDYPNDLLSFIQCDLDDLHKQYDDVIQRLDFEIEKAASNFKNKKLPAQLEVSLSDIQRDILYRELVSVKIITPGDKESFIYVFGGKNPETFTPIYWKFGANALFELLEALTDTVSNENLKRCTNLFSTKNGLLKNVSRPKNINRDRREYSRCIKDIETIKGKLFPTT